VAEPDRRDDTLAKITRLTGIFALDRARVYREPLRRLMRRAVRQGVRRDEVIARSALPREEADGLLREDPPADRGE
jgi:hypothetical protein